MADEQITIDNHKTKVLRKKSALGRVGELIICAAFVFVGIGMASSPHSIEWYWGLIPIAIGGIGFIVSIKETHKELS